MTDLAPNAPPHLAAAPGQSFPPLRDDGVYPRWMQHAARLIMRAMRWRVSAWNVPIGTTKLVIICTHSSNMDAWLVVIGSMAVGMRASYLVKSELNRPVLGWLIRKSGGIFVNRRAAHGLVGEVVRQFATRPYLSLVITPEGTRSRADVWKMGFYYIVQQASVPLALGYAHYPRREMGIAELATLTGDIDADERMLNAFYADKIPRHPEKVGPVVLKRSRATTRTATPAVPATEDEQA